VFENIMIAALMFYFGVIIFFFISVFTSVKSKVKKDRISRRRNQIRLVKGEYVGKIRNRY
jgi:hypothetical protein